MLNSALEIPCDLGGRLSHCQADQFRDLGGLFNETVNSIHLCWTIAAEAAIVKPRGMAWVWRAVQGRI